MSAQPLYSVTTWDGEQQRFTPQDGLPVPSQGITLSQVRHALRALQATGYDCKRKRSADGFYYWSDPSVLVERIN